MNKNISVRKIGICIVYLAVAESVHAGCELAKRVLAVHALEPFSTHAREVITGRRIWGGSMYFITWFYYVVTGLFT